MSELESGSLGAASSLMTAALNYYEAASQLDGTDVKLMVSVSCSSCSCQAAAFTATVRLHVMG